MRLVTIESASQTEHVARVALRVADHLVVGAVAFVDGWWRVEVADDRGALRKLTCRSRDKAARVVVDYIAEEAADLLLWDPRAWS